MFADDINSKISDINVDDLLVGYELWTSQNISLVFSK